MLKILKQSTAATIKMGPFVDSTDGSTAETALSIAQADIRLSKNGGDIAQSNNSTGATHDEAGYYDVPLDTTDTNTLGRLKVMVSKSGALPIWDEYTVVTANVYDSLIAASDNLQVDTTQVNGTSQTGRDLGASVLVGDKTGFALTAAYDPAKTTAQASALTTVEGKIDAIDDYVDAEVAAIKAKTDLIPASPAATGDIPLASSIAIAVWAASGRTLSSFGTLVTDIWSAATRSITDKAGFTLHADYDAAKTASQAGDAMDLVAAPSETALNAIADAILKRDWSGLTGEASRSMLNALRFLRNKWSISAGTLTVTKENDTTAAWTGAVTTDADAEPITGNDPS